MQSADEDFDPATLRGLRVVFMYLGRGGALARFAELLAHSAKLIDGLDASFVVSRMNAHARQSLSHEPSTLALPTFESASPIAATRNFFRARQSLVEHLASRRPHAVVNLMPHVWTALWVAAIRKHGTPFVSVVHDAVSHPGDPTGRLLHWLHREARSADLVVTLSRHVAGQLQTRGVVPRERTTQLFLPDLGYGAPGAVRTRSEARPLKLLFFGRILKYKGLSLLLDALELLRAKGIAVELGVVGVGKIRDERARLQSLGAEIINRWIEDHEIPPLLARYDAMVVPHIECSQSAVAATAFGSGMPVVGMPVGGIAEQIIDGHTGVLAQEVTAKSLAGAIRKLATDGELYRAICCKLLATSESRSMHLFLRRALQEIARLPSGFNSAAGATRNATRGVSRYGRWLPAH